MPRYRTLTGIFTWQVTRRALSCKVASLADLPPAALERTFENMNDMLRYDEAFINAEMPGIVLTFKVKHPGYGVGSGRVTDARWESFGFKIERTSPERALSLADAMGAWDKWYTARHPRAGEFGARDYGKLEKITLQQFLREEFK